MIATVALSGTGAIGAAPPVAATSGPGVLAAGVILREGDAVWSPNGQYELALVRTGALVVRNANFEVEWSNGASSRSGALHVELERDGDLVASRADGSVVWASRTRSATGARLVVTDDGDVAVIDGAHMVWSTHTARPSALPEGLDSAGRTSQLLIVTSASASSSVDWLTAYQHTALGWVREFPPMRARSGVNGWISPAHRTEGDGTTPEGVYSIGDTVYGTDPDPGTAMRYHRLVAGDYWDENPATGARYNTFEHSSDTDCAANPFGGDTECLWLEPAAYPYLAVIDFNIPATSARGSGIFLHATIGATAGCVSVSVGNLARLLRWMRPAARPRIVLAGAVTLSRW